MIPLVRARAREENDDGRRPYGDHRSRSRGPHQAIETLLREGLGRVGEADVIEPKMPTSVEEVENLSWDELNLVFATTHAHEIRAVVERGDAALRSELEKWGPDERATSARQLCNDRGEIPERRRSDAPVFRVP